MSLEKDITTIKRLVEQGDPLFKAASDSDLNQREIERVRIEKERQDRLEKERQEKEARIAKAKADAVVKMKRTLKLLGMTTIKHDPNTWGSYTTGSNPDGEQIHMRLRDDRITVYGEYPHARGENYVSDVYNATGGKMYRPEITISALKTPEQMAKDIQRRFSPYHKEYHAAARKRAESHDAYEDKTLASLTALKGYKLDDYEAKNKQISLTIDNLLGEDNYARGTAKVSGNRIDLELDGLSLEQAKNIMKIVNGKAR